MPRERHLAHARHRDPIDLGQSALLVIDCQRAFVSAAERTCVVEAEPTLRRINTLCRAFHDAGRPVLATRHAHVDVPTGPGMGSWWSSFLLEGSSQAELGLGAALGLVDQVLAKHTYSAFRSGVLERTLRSRGLNTLVLAGFQTHICVDTTARDAFQSGHNVVVVEDACSARERALHDAALQCLSSACARIATTRDILRWLGPSAAHAGPV